MPLTPHYEPAYRYLFGLLLSEPSNHVFLFDSEESFGPDGISLRGALEAGGP